MHDSVLALVNEIRAILDAGQSRFDMDGALKSRRRPPTPPTYRGAGEQQRDHAGLVMSCGPRPRPQSVRLAATQFGWVPDTQHLPRLMTRLQVRNSRSVCC